MIDPDRHKAIVEHVGELALSNVHADKDQFITILSDDRFFDRQELIYLGLILARAGGGK